MPRQRGALNSLKKPKYRPSWNKYNLYNMGRVANPFKEQMTYYQQKWYAKSNTRTYHGDTIKEKQWQRIFRPDMRSVVTMNAEQLGTDDGSDFSAGRGSGQTRKPKDGEGTLSTRMGSRRKPVAVPYMNMVYHQLERRLDVAIWRALFASSTRQARQFCTHGGVKVNGRKMIYPGYQLNPGDMFQVDVERVMFATGARKNYWERRFGRQDRRRGYGVVREQKEHEAETDKEAKEEKEEESESTETSSLESSETTTPKSNQSKDKLQEFLAAAQATLNHPRSKNDSAAHKRALREFTRTLRRELSNKASWNTPVDEQIVELASKLSLNTESTTKPVAEQTQVSETPRTIVSGAKIPGELTQTLLADQERMLQTALTAFKQNPLDYTKGYKTPWEPRPFMSPFAFIPRYLEVHAPICAAVYLRHPVARSGLGEVPTPYDANTSGLAFNWYLRRR